MTIKEVVKVMASVGILLWMPLAQSNEAMPQHMVFASDPQYPWTDKTDSGEHESDDDFDQRSKWLVDTQFASIADFRRQMGGQAQVPLMINGDITAFGHPYQISFMKSALNKHFGRDYLYGLGNHDYENNIDDCFGNRCAANSVVAYEEHHRGKVDEFDLRVTGGGFGKQYNGSLAYSKDVGEVRLIQLNNEPTYAVDIVHPVHDFKITQSLDWLEINLRLARVQGYAIIINMHKPYDWNGNWDQEKRFRNMIEQYQVTAIFAGHLHRNGGRVSQIGTVPMFLSGAASQQTYLIASFSKDRKQLEVSLVERNEWRKREPVATVPVKSIWAERP